MGDGTRNEAGSPSPRPRRVFLSRRRFLALTLGGGAFVLLGGFLYRFRIALYGKLLARDLDVDTGTGELSGPEMRTMIAFGEVLYPSEYAAGGRFVDRGAEVTRETVSRLTTQVPGRLHEFQLGADLLDRRSRSEHGTEFADLSLAQRRALVDALMLRVAGASPAPRALFILTGGRRSWRLWHHVARVLLTGFYRSYEGWRIVGYPTQPGDCTDLEGYQHPPVLQPG